MQESARSLTDGSSTDSSSADRRTVLVTGATGYVGGRLVSRLLAEGYAVRCLVRSVRKAGGRAWASDPGVTLVEGSLEDSDVVERALRGCEAAYYLVHSMIVAGTDYREKDRRLAETFRGAAERADVGRIIYLGGLGELGEGLSEHLSSRRETEEALAAGPIPLTTLRAAMIIGSGSASFEILRYLVERLPVMVTPLWVRTECQPIAIGNVLHYLVATLTTPETTGRTLDIGGPEVLDYLALMRHMAEARGLPRRLIIPVPVLTPRLSSMWIHLITPISHRIARPLAEGLRNRVVCRDDEAARLMPQKLLTVRESIDEALGNAEIETSWSDAGPIPGDPDWAGGKVFVDRREIRIEAEAPSLFRAVCRVGGGHGWYAADWLWRVRGLMDRLVGGPGLRRGRRDPVNVGYGEALDFWRVTDVVQDQRLELRAEMKLPGEATLTFDIEQRDDHSLLVQTARFKPRGLFGLAYWYAVLPLHGFVFRGMLKGIKAKAEAPAATSSISPAAGVPE